MSVSVGVWGGGGCLMSLHIHLTSVSPSPPPGRRERARDDRGKRKPQRTQRRRGDTHQRGEDQSHQQTEGHKTLIIPRSNRVATNHLKKSAGRVSQSIPPKSRPATASSFQTKQILPRIEPPKIYAKHSSSGNHGIDEARPVI